jgi:hypothetical protein
MKNSLVKLFGVLGLVIYYPLIVVIRLLVALILVVLIAFFLLLWNPITRNDSSPTWLNNLYDWYCGK